MNETLVETLASHGRFNAFLREPRSDRGQKNPAYVVRFRMIVADDLVGTPGLKLLKSLQEQGNQRRGKLWHTDAGYSGWSIEHVEDVEALAWSFAHSAKLDFHPRAEVVDAWVKCVKLMPGPKKKEIDLERAAYEANPKAVQQLFKHTGSYALPRYRSEDFLLLRRAAVAVLQAAVKQYPRLPLEPLAASLYEEELTF